MQLAWVTDPHLEWLNDHALGDFLRRLSTSETDGVVISGDISDAKHIKYHLKVLGNLPMPVYFVLGNHDIYAATFEHVYAMVRRSVEDHKNLFWLTNCTAIKLTDHTYLIGHDGWADGRAGGSQRSGLLLNDYRAIYDFHGLTVGATFGLMQKIADKASNRLTNQILKIGARHIIVVTHAPPYVRACMYNGLATDDMYIPHFSNVGMGKALSEVACKTNARLSILCGHTHEEVRVNINDKIAVWVGQATYGSPTYTTIDVDLGC